MFDKDNKMNVVDDCQISKTRRISEEEVRSFSVIQQYIHNLGRLPLWILAWFGLTAVVCSWDASFVLLRPLSFPGANLGAFWLPYKMYITVDQRYMDINDGFVVAISLLNFAEVIFNIFTIVLHVTKNKHTVRVGFTVSVMTFWKTVLYLLMFMDVCGGAKYRVHNTLAQEIFIYILPNIMWVFIPGVVMLVLWNKLMPPLPSPEIIFTTQNDKNNNIEQFYAKRCFDNNNTINEQFHQSVVCNDVATNACTETATSQRLMRYKTKMQ